MDEKRRSSENDFLVAFGDYIVVSVFLHETGNVNLHISVLGH